MTTHDDTESQTARAAILETVTSVVGKCGVVLASTPSSRVETQDVMVFGTLGDAKNYYE